MFRGWHSGAVLYVELVKALRLPIAASVVSSNRVKVSPPESESDMTFVDCTYVPTTVLVKTEMGLSAAAHAAARVLPE